jgi:hypothetical protein
MSDQVQVSRDVRAGADQVWAMVSDITRMGEWSPESVGGKWVGGATGPETGARFRGDNRHGSKSWSTAAKVVEAAPGTVFAFDVTAAGFKVANWRYTFEPIEGGCRVTETWTDQRGRVAKALGKPVSGVAERAAHNRAGMEATLERLAAAAESSAG